MTPNLTNAATDVPPPPPETGSAVPGRLRRTLMSCAAMTLAAGLIAGGTVAVHLAAEAAPRPPAAPLTTVDVLVPERATGHDVHRQYAARVEPAREARLSFEAGGTLVDVAVEEGDRVAAGTVLARLDTRLLLAKRERLVAARLALDSDAELAALSLARQRTLEARGFAADEALDRARLGSSRLRARMAEADAAIALVDIELDKAMLRAPFDALIGERMLDEGATASVGTPVLKLFESGRTRLRVGLPPAVASTLDRSKDFRFVAGSRTLTARLLSLRGDVDAATRTVSAVFAPADATDTGADDTFFVGELLELELTERVAGVVFDLPLTALAENERGLWNVLALVDEPEDADATDAANADASAPSDRVARLRRVAVEIVHVTGDRVWASAAFDDDTRIVANGRHRVVAGERVRASPLVRDGDADVGNSGVLYGVDAGTPAVHAGKRGS